jgi:hypothetical protein
MSTVTATLTHGCAGVKRPGADRTPWGRDARLECTRAQPLRAREEHGADDDEGERVLDLDGQVSAREALGDTEDERADDGAGEAVEPAEDSGGEPLQEGIEHEEGIQAQRGSEEDPGNHAERRGHTAQEPSCKLN